ncbi:MAG TPA: VOC family protein [Longimicrobium sp.]
MKLQRIIPELIVADVGKSIQFYVDILAFEVREVAPSMENPSWAQLVAGTTPLMLQERASVLDEIPILRSRSGPGSGILVFAVESRETARVLHLQIKDRANEVSSLLETEYGSTEFTLTDPDGYILLISGKD